MLLFVCSVFSPLYRYPLCAEILRVVIVIPLVVELEFALTVYLVFGIIRYPVIPYEVIYLLHRVR